jgi:hypothetical protein
MKAKSNTSKIRVEMRIWEIIYMEMRIKLKKGHNVLGFEKWTAQYVSILWRSLLPSNSVAIRFMLPA